MHLPVLPLSSILISIAIVNYSISILNTLYLLSKVNVSLARFLDPNPVGLPLFPLISILLAIIALVNAKTTELPLEEVANVLIPIGFC